MWALVESGSVSKIYTRPTQIKIKSESDTAFLRSVVKINLYSL